MRYFETQNGDYVALEHTGGFESMDYGEDNLLRFTLRAQTVTGGWTCGKYETLADVEHAKLAVILWAINDDVKLFSFKRDNEGPAWKLARMGPGIIDLIESAEAYRQMQGRKSVAGQTREEELIAQARRDVDKLKGWNERVTGVCPECGYDVVTSFFTIEGRSAPVVSSDCWNALGPNPTCKYSKTL